MTLIKYKVVRSNRKTLSLQIKPNSEVIVRAPLQTSQKLIEQFIAKYTNWINDRLNKINLSLATHEKDRFFYLGNAYKWHECAHLRDVQFDKDNLYTGLNQDEIIAWQKQQLSVLVLDIVNEYVAKYAFKYRQIKFNSAKSRWGSCSSAGNISFSYRLLMLPSELIRYVVAHELAHLTHHNHSAQFWQLVAVLYPDYKRAHAWLREHKYQLATAIN